MPGIAFSQLCTEQLQRLLFQLLHFGIKRIFAQFFLQGFLFGGQFRFTENVELLLQIGDDCFRCLP